MKFIETKISNLIPGKEAELKEYFKDYCEKNDPKELKNLYFIKFLLFILNFLDIISFNNRLVYELLKFVLPA